MRIRRFAKVLAAFLTGVMLVHLLYACSPRSQAADKTRLTIATVNNGGIGHWAWITSTNAHP